MHLVSLQNKIPVLIVLSEKINGAAAFTFLVQQPHIYCVLVFLIMVKNE